METNLSLQGNKSGNGLINNVKASKNTITDLMVVQDGDTILLPGRRNHLRHDTGNQAATGSQLGAGIRGKHHPGLNSIFSSLIVQRCQFACPKFNLLAIDGERRGADSRPTAHHIFSCTVVARTCLYLLSECTVAH